MTETNPLSTGPDGLFIQEAGGLPDSMPTKVVELRNGDTYALRISPIRNRIAGNDLRMLGYNGSIPGPTLDVDQGSQIYVQVANDADVDATVHWHGLRLENKYDGVPGDTQAPIPAGSAFTYRLQFPDPGIYWYHPHIREDYGLEMGLYGTIVVEPTDERYWPAVDRWLTLTLDDLLVEDGRIAPFSRTGPNFTAMGRFGNLMLTNGQTEFAGVAEVGEVMRLYVVNTANTRIFNFSVVGAQMKLIGGDSGRYEREVIVSEVLLAPSERAVIDVLFDEPGNMRLEHRTPDRVYDLGGFIVSGSSAGHASESFGKLRVDAELAAERESLDDDLRRAPDKILAFVAQMPMLHEHAGEMASSYGCPMHPDVTAAEPGKCPKCGMALMPVSGSPGAASTYSCPMHADVIASSPGTCPRCGMALTPSVANQPPSAHAATAEHSHDHDHDERGDGLEWEDLMPEMNRASDSSNMTWQIVDREDGAVNAAIKWRLHVGERVKIRLVNEMESDHPMHHPFHVHGAGRFLILAQDGIAEPNLVWKDTVLVPAGRTVDILLDVTNPGLWMAHCHIAEHAQTGMMFSFEVAARPEEGPTGS